MENNDEKVYLDDDGYRNLLKEIEKLKQKLKENGKEKGEAYSGATGDGWHDNFAFDEANMQERIIVGQLQDCYSLLQRVVIVKKSTDDSLIDINDIVKVNMIYGDDDEEEFEFKLVGTNGSMFLDSELECISINSPLGKAVYHKHVGEKSSYKVEKRKFDIEILSKKSENKLSKAKQIKKVK